MMARLKDAQVQSAAGGHEDHRHVLLTDRILMKKHRQSQQLRSHEVACPVRLAEVVPVVR